jgi:hypothetical protein
LIEKTRILKTKIILQKYGGVKEVSTRPSCTVVLFTTTATHNTNVRYRFPSKLMGVADLAPVFMEPFVSNSQLPNLCNWLYYPINAQRGNW